MNASQGTGPVQTRLDGDVLVVTIDNPPVNALGQAVRAGLLAAVEELERTGTGVNLAALRDRLA